MTTHWPLAAEFPASTRDDWMKAVDAVLKGKPFEKALVNHTADAIRIEPVYQRHAEAGRAAGRAAGEPWDIICRIDHPEAKMANSLALADLEGGATGLALVMAGSASARGDGLASTGDIAPALHDVMLDLIRLRVEAAPFAAMPVFTALDALVKASKLNPATLTIDFGLDPLGHAASSGLLPKSWTEMAAELGENARTILAAGYKTPFVRADGRPAHEAGSSEAQELAFALASAVSSLRALEGAGIPLAEAARLISVILVADSDQFLTMAKFRAMRRLWTRIEEACGLTPSTLALHAETAYRAMTRRDPWVNILRGTMATFSSGIAGAASVTVLPFTQAAGLPDEFARRVARNTSLVLIYESNLHRVADPAAGSGGIAALTEQLSEKAWSLFQDIEKQGGLAASLASGHFQRLVAETQAKRARDIATRREPITGVSEFPDITEKRVTVLDTTKPAVPALPQAAIRFAPLVSRRLAESFEALRDLGEAKGASIFLANLGLIADFTARATFAKNAFEAGGIRALGNEGFADAEALIAAFKASGTSLACICSTDAIYAEQAAEIAGKLKSAGAKHLFLAGKPADEAAMRAAGIDDFVFMGTDILSLMDKSLRLV